MERFHTAHEQLLPEFWVVQWGSCSICLKCSIVNKSGILSAAWGWLCTQLGYPPSPENGKYVYEYRFRVLENAYFVIKLFGSRAVLWVISGFESLRLSQGCKIFIRLSWRSAAICLWCNKRCSSICSALPIHKWEVRNEMLITCRFYWALAF